MIKLIFLALVIFTLVFTLYKVKVEHMDEQPDTSTIQKQNDDANINLDEKNIVPTNYISICGNKDDELAIEDCLVNSKGKFMDDFIKCLGSKNIKNPKKIIDNFSPLQYSVIMSDLDAGKNLDCDKLSKAIFDAQNN